MATARRERRDWKPKARGTRWRENGCHIDAEDDEDPILSAGKQEEGLREAGEAEGKEEGAEGNESCWAGGIEARVGGEEDTAEIHLREKQAGNRNASEESERVSGE